MLNKKRGAFIFSTLLTISLTSPSYATGGNFNCPSPTEIQSTDFTAPSIWIAPPVAHSTPGEMGVGLGGKTAQKWLGVERATVNHKDGWVCVYQSSGGMSVYDYENKILNVINENKFLIKYKDKVIKAFTKAEPYLKNYPQNEPIGFIGYTAEQSTQLQSQKK